MSKSRLKPEDIFFGLQKAHENETRANKKPEFEEETSEAGETKPEPALTEKIGSDFEAAETNSEKEIKAAGSETVEKEKTATFGKKKPGPAAKVDNANRVSINILVPPEVKYKMVAVINEMKLRGIKKQYNITDFVIEAIEEKVAHTKSSLDL